jgi:quercetin dioxygenase-like cupin family protein
MRFVRKSSGIRRQRVGRSINVRAIVGVAIFLTTISSGWSETTTPKIVRKELFKAQIGRQPVSTVDVREIVFQPGQKTGLHRHPCPVLSYVAEGTIRFQLRGQKIQIVRAGHICYEPARAIIEKYDNASDTARARFICFYLLDGQKELIEMLQGDESRNR